MSMKLSEVKNDKPINILCHDGTVVIENDRSDVAELDPITTVQFARTITPSEWAYLKSNRSFMRLFRLVFEDIELSGTPLQQLGTGVQHIVGLIVLTMFALKEGMTPFWRTPEAHLHPKQQLGLADLLIVLTKGTDHDERKAA